MASQIGKKRVYTSIEEANSPRIVQCVKCNVQAVPKGLATDHRNVAGLTAAQEGYCPNCGHVHGRKNH